MSRVWKLAVPLAVLIVVGGYAVGSLAASDLDDVAPRQPIVVGDAGADRGTTGKPATDDRRQRPDQKDDQRGDDGRTAGDDADDDDVAVVRPDVDDVDDRDDGDDGDDRDDD
jgi:hypothetical protein